MKFSPINKNILLIWVGIGLLGFLEFFVYFDHTFPEASVELNLSRVEALTKAKEFIQKQGYDVSEYDTSVNFGTCDSISYLQQEFGIKKTNELYRTTVPCWSWEINFFKELQEEQFFVDINTGSGKITYFEHQISKLKEGAKFDQHEALGIAENFLLNKGFDLDLYDLTQNSTNKKPNRNDHLFGWAKKNDWLGKSYYYLQVKVKGERVSFYEENISIFDDHQRKMAKKGTVGMILMTFFSIISGVLGICAIITLIIQHKRSRIRWKLAFLLACAPVVLTILSFFNSQSITWHMYTTTMSYKVFWMLAFVMTIMGGIFYGLTILVFFGSGETLSHKLKHNSFPILNSILNKRIKIKDAFSRVLIGYCLGLFFLGFVTLFYLIATKYFGVWRTLTPDYSNILSTGMPFLYPLTIALFASISEEFMFRLFAISYFRQFSKNTILIVIFSAMIWGFGHSAYPVYPTYVRAIELTIMGTIMGLMYLRYGIETVIIAHYVFNAILVGLPLLRSGNTYFTVSGFIVIILFFLPLLIFSIMEVKTSKKKRKRARKL